MGPRRGYGLDPYPPYPLWAQCSYPPYPSYPAMKLDMRNPLSSFSYPRRGPSGEGEGKHGGGRGDGGGGGGPNLLTLVRLDLGWVEEGGGGDRRSGERRGGGCFFSFVLFSNVPRRVDVTGLLGALCNLDASIGWNTCDKLLGSINPRYSTMRTLPIVIPHNRLNQPTEIIRCFGLGVGNLNGATHFAGINSMFSSIDPNPCGIS